MFARAQQCSVLILFLIFAVNGDLISAGHCRNHCSQRQCRRHPPSTSNTVASEVLTELKVQDEKLDRQLPAVVDRVIGELEKMCQTEGLKRSAKDSLQGGGGPHMDLSGSNAFASLEREIKIMDDELDRQLALVDRDISEMEEMCQTEGIDCYGEGSLLPGEGDGPQADLPGTLGSDVVKIDRKLSGIPGEEQLVPKDREASELEKKSKIGETNGTAEESLQGYRPQKDLPESRGKRELGLGAAQEMAFDGEDDFNTSVIQLQIFADRIENLNINGNMGEGSLSFPATSDFGGLKGDGLESFAFVVGAVMGVVMGFVVSFVGFGCAFLLRATVTFVTKKKRMRRQHRVSISIGSILPK